MRNTILIAALGLVACDGGGKDTSTEEQTPVAEGSWGAEEVSAVDTCGFFDEEEDDDDGGPITLTMTSDTSFTFSDGTPDFDLTCELADDLSFTCPGGTDVQSLDGKGLDAEITAAVSYSGAFDSRTTGSFIIQIDVTCGGDDCLKLKKYEGIVFPCGYTNELAISAVE